MMSQDTRKPTVDVRPIVDTLLAEAVELRASDLHLEPLAQSYEARLRVDGLLKTAFSYDLETGKALVARLMVLGNLLTYRQDVPQEGRMEWTAQTKPATVGAAAPLMFRLSIMPTTHGLRAAVRLPADLMQPQVIEQLGLPAYSLEQLKLFAAADAGMLILTGPAGSGKTTTIYTLLDYISQRYPGLSIIALEDPVERDLAGVTQIQVSPFGELTYERALRSILRQDPQVLMLGEIRDAATATLAIQAALSGHRLISTLHAGTPAGAVARLLEMGLEPYQITAALTGGGIVAQRLVRRKAPQGYAGRLPLAEMALMTPDLREAILRRADVDSLAKIIAAQPGHNSFWQAADSLIQNQLTDEAEVLRVLGPRPH